MLWLTVTLALLLALLSGFVALRLRRSRASERELALQRAYFADLFESAPAAIAILDGQDRVVDVNREFTRLFGYSPEEAAGRPINDLIVPPELRAEGGSLTRSVTQGQEIQVETVRQHKDGTPVHVSILGKPFTYGGERRVYGSYLDIGERRQLEERLRDAQKLEAVGRLAGGVAHDFNNLLTVIIGQAQLLLTEAGTDSLREGLAEIDRAAGRAAELTQQLLAFGRRQVLRPTLIDLNALVVEMEPLLEATLGPDIELVRELDPGLAHVRADRGQLEQILMNLASNARDAMISGGRLTIGTANVEFEPEAGRAEPPPGRYVRLTVADTGTGMSEALQRRVFEPFFTTKQPGKGTGMGLPMVYGFVKQSGGHIELESAPGEGARFLIYLAQAEPAAEPVVPATPRTGSATRGGETVLVVEDDDGVRQLAQRILEQHGYRVLAAGDGLDALELFTRELARVDLVLTDLVMPNVGGRELAERLRTLRPDVAVLYMTAYPESQLPQAAGEPELDVVRKPFTPSLLAGRVREALDARFAS